MTRPESSSEKATLRERMRKLRAAIPDVERARRGALMEAEVLRFPAVNRSRTVLLFYSFGTEIPTSGLARHLHDAGKRLLFPFIDGERLEAGEVRPGEALVDTDYGPKEPPERRAVGPDEIDVVITPGLAFDREGRRLGYGRGFYDRYLGRLRPEAMRVGLAFSEQVVDRVPTGTADERVHLVVTENGVIDCRITSSGE